MGKGRGTGGDAHKLTPSNTVPLPKAKFEPPNTEKIKLKEATPSLFPQKHKKNGKILYFFVFSIIFFQNRLLWTIFFAFYPLPTHTLTL